MNERPSLLRRIALALMEQAARVFPSAQEPWVKAMQRELAEIKNDREALTWAGGCLFAGCIERGRAMGVIFSGAFLAVAAIGAASWWAGQRPYLTPGHDLVFRDASNLGAMAGFLLFWPAAALGLRLAFALLTHCARKFHFHDLGTPARVCAAIVGPYLAALVLVSLRTPRTIVNIGDRYCYDLWCFGVNQVTATPQGQAILYTASVRVSVDSTHDLQIPAEGAKGFFYVLDDKGRRYPLLRDASFAHADVTVHPGESVKSSLAFLAPPNARKLYLVGNNGEVYLPWIYLYFGSDISLFHRPARLRIL